MSSAVHYNNIDSIYTLTNELTNYITQDTIIVCIGTDKCIGDCLGPLVGTMLKDSSFHLPVNGTLSSPIAFSPLAL